MCNQIILLHALIMDHCSNLKGCLNCPTIWRLGSSNIPYNPSPLLSTFPSALSSTHLSSLFYNSNTSSRFFFYNSNTHFLFSFSLLICTYVFLSILSILYILYFPHHLYPLYYLFHHILLSLMYPLPPLYYFDRLDHLTSLSEFPLSLVCPLSL